VRPVETVCVFVEFSSAGFVFFRVSTTHSHEETSFHQRPGRLQTALQPKKTIRENRTNKRGSENP
jgi:hypothetical protein